MIADDLGKIEITMAKLALMRVHERVGNLDDIHVNQSYQVLRHVLRERAQVHHFNDGVEVIIQLAELGQLHVKHVVFEHIVGLNDVLGFWRHVNPVVNYAANVLIGRIALTASRLNFFRI